MQISTPKIQRIYLPLAIVFAVLVLLMPRTAKFNYDYKKGTPWPYETLVSEFDFPILKTADQMEAERESAGSIVIPYYRYSEEVTSSVVKNVQSLDLGKHNSLRPAIVNRLSEIYARGVISDSRFNLNGEPDPEAGLKLLQRIREEDEYLPLLLQSSETNLNITVPGVSFLDKNSKKFNIDLRNIMSEHFGFGDFLFRDPDTKEVVCRVRNLKELQDNIFKIPENSMHYHVSHNHISGWRLVPYSPCQSS